VEINRLESFSHVYAPYAAYIRHPFRSPRYSALTSGRPPEERDYITDVELSLWTGPGRDAACPEDLRVYFVTPAGASEITAAIRDQIVAVLSGPDARQYQDAYRRSLENWIESVKLIPEPLRPDLGAEKELVKRLLSQPPNEWVRRLGDRTIGWGGNAHIVNHLYRDIPFPPLSLRALANIGGDPNQQDLFEGSALVVSFGDWLGGRLTMANNIGGGIACQLAYRHHNPNDDKIDEILARLQGIEDDLSYIKTRLQQLTQMVFKLGESLDHAGHAVSSHDDQLRRTVGALQELKAAVDKIH
jgi:hypothetical protein